MVSPQFLAKLLRKLPPTLYNKNYRTISDCGKVPWGLSLPSGLRGIFTTQYVHQVVVRDSRNVVTPLVQDDI